MTVLGARAVSASADGTLKVWDLMQRKVIRTLTGHTAGVWDVVLTSDGRRAVSVANDSTHKVWDLSHGTVITTFSADGSLLTCAIAPDDVTIVSGGSSGRLHFLRLQEM